MSTPTAMMKINSQVETITAHFTPKICGTPLFVHLAKFVIADTVWHDLMQLLKVAFGYDIGADSHETIEFPLLIQHLAVSRYVPAPNPQRFVGLLVVQQGYFVRNDDTLGLGALSQILAGADDRATRLLTMHSISLMVAIAPSPSHGCLIRF